MNIRSHQQSVSPARHQAQNVKLSPDSVAQGTTLLQCPPQPLPMDRFKPMRQDDELNLPPISTPVHHRKLRTLPQGALIDLAKPLVRPPLPPRSPIIKSRPRSVSESDGSSTTARREIFGNYWGQSKRSVSTGTRSGSSTGSRVSSVQHSNFEAKRKRSSSLSILETTLLLDEPTDYRMYAPPIEHARTSSICSRFAPVEALVASNNLPPLPTPLQRLCSDSSTRSLSGMYPLVNAAPILRQSSYRSTFGEHVSSFGDSTNNEKSELDESIFNLTKSVRRYNTNSHELVYTESSSSSSISADFSAGVRFDPRVTVTEFEDSVPRIWYNDVELDRLKQETILIAQEFLMTNVSEAEKYNRAKLDPVTGTFRKRALFSLPVLSSVLDDHVQSAPNKDFEDLAKSQVKNILIVDPNKAILALFNKSLKSMFPRASLHCTQSGEEALQMVSRSLQRNYGSSPFQHRNYDIIVVEQRLLQNQVDPKPVSGGKKQANGSASCLNITEMTTNDSFPTLRKPNSFNEAALQRPNNFINMCGSNLLKAINDMESDIFDSRSYHAPNPCQAEASSISTKQFQWRALLIGVSIQPDRDAKTLQEAGADVIWGKPIPKVGDALRNQLINSLMNKRHSALNERRTSASKNLQ